MQAGEDLTVPQFRTLLYLWRTPGVSASSLARHLGLSLPTVSALVQGLVTRGLVDRAVAASDRRRVALTASSDGVALVEAARDANRARLARRLDALPPAGRADLHRALDMLHGLFADAREGD